MINEEGLVVMRDRYAAEVRQGQWYGWLFIQNMTGGWTPVRKLASWEIMEAESRYKYTPSYH